MEHVTYSLEDTVATITIDRPKALNALNSEVLEQLDHALHRAESDMPRCVVVTGAGEKAFVAGADVVAMSTMTRREAEAFSRVGNRVFRRLEQLPCPTIAAVSGFALGGGCELALACDLRVASTTASFGQPEVGLGITPGFGGTQRLPRLIGLARAKELLFTARRVGADEALALGLVNRVVEPGDLLTEVMALAQQIASQGPIAVRATKAALQLGAQTDLDTALSIEATEFASCFETHDQVEAMTAFTRRRPAEPFEGR